MISAFFIVLIANNLLVSLFSHPIRTLPNAPAQLKVKMMVTFSERFTEDTVVRTNAVENKFFCYFHYLKILLLIKCISVSILKIIMPSITTFHKILPLAAITYKFAVGFNFI